MPGTLVFSHANGFPAGTYRLLFEAWRDAGWRVAAIEKFGHEPAFPVTGNWPRLREQLLQFIAAQGGPVHLVGHSLGGYLSLMAACRRPPALRDRVRSVVLIDSPVLTGWRAHSVQMMKLGGIFKRFTPGRVSQRRRWQWPAADAALAHFQSKAAFGRWHPEVLRDYIAAGMEADPDALPGAVRLAFHRDIETALYNTLPHNLGRMLQRHPLQLPVAYLAGTRSVEGRQVGLAATRALVQERIEWIDGSHLFPMEKPAETAAAVLRHLQSVEAARLARPPRPGSLQSS